ncbi:MAG: hypothetical protein KIT34_01460 [Cyanobacteria bacterium TGS_CYA1]|nr:hypothetical protein [Cyanobacteria bacterium TGS_CYA1]
MSRIFSGLFGLSVIGFVLAFMKMKKMSASGWKVQKQNKEIKKESDREVVHAS